MPVVQIISSDWCDRGQKQDKRLFNKVGPWEKSFNSSYTQGAFILTFSPKYCVNGLMVGTDPWKKAMAETILQR